MIGKTVLSYESCIIKRYSTRDSSLRYRLMRPIWLTPRHFLIGDLIASMHEVVDVTTLLISRSLIWQHAQQMRQHFWTRWHKKCLSSFAIRRNGTPILPSQLSRVHWWSSEKTMFHLYSGRWDEAPTYIQVQTTSYEHRQDIQQSAQAKHQYTAICYRLNQM